ncbi:RNA-guided endonuclease InsQ/TnpB family protein, partial [Armatimonas sp.]|uniref:RNA-guided endonuclease InsQ/TnpB family protein n=1 Tax=Armatimonas sp. TaxID=1872638 RepID=UPI00375038BE
MWVVKLVAQVKLLPTQEQREYLKKTLEAANQAANVVSDDAFASKVFKRFDLHYLWYETLRKDTGLTAQVVALLFAKVADAYKLDKLTQRSFRPHGAIAYDSRILRYMLDKKMVSIWTVNGRERIPFVCGDYQTRLLEGQRGESELVFVDGEFYLMAVCDVQDPPLREVNGVLGVDLGIAQLATDSEGNQYSGLEVRTLRRRMRRLRAGLQQCGSESAKRHLQRLRRRQSRFTKWVNHNISRRLVETAAKLGKALALENLQGIRDRGNGLATGRSAPSFNREMRFELGNWSFYQLLAMVEYKAKRAGLPVFLVDPAYTSRTCSVCGYCDKHNRKSQSQFQCLSCGLELNADCNAAL